MGRPQIKYGSIEPESTDPIDMTGRPKTTTSNSTWSPVSSIAREKAWRQPRCPRRRLRSLFLNCLVQKYGTVCCAHSLYRWMRLLLEPSFFRLTPYRRISSLGQELSAHMKRISDDLKRHVSSRCLIQYSSLAPFASADRHAFFFLRITCLFFTQASWEFPLAIIDLYTSTLELQFYCYCAS